MHLRRLESKNNNTEVLSNEVISFLKEKIKENAKYKALIGKWEVIQARTGVETGNGLRLQLDGEYDLWGKSGKPQPWQLIRELLAEIYRQGFPEPETKKIDIIDIYTNLDWSMVEKPAFISIQHGICIDALIECAKRDKLFKQDQSLAFLSGTQARLGADSIIRRHYATSTTYDKNLNRVIFQFINGNLKDKKPVIEAEEVNNEMNRFPRI